MSQLVTRPTFASPTSAKMPTRLYTAWDLLALSDRELMCVDPLEINLLVAKEIPSLVNLEIAVYQRRAEVWAEGLRRYIRALDHHFWQTPQDWKNDIRYFRLGLLCQFLDLELKIAYKEEQRDVKEISYIDPSDLFLNGVMETRRGTCGNMAALHVALGWRMGWPVSLARVNSHYICRYDDGEVTYNIEATDTGRGGFSSRTDKEYVAQYALPLKAISCGSDLRALAPRELLGEFIHLRARHLRDSGQTNEGTKLLDAAERDYSLARYLNPASRCLYRNGVGLSVMRGAELFDVGEVGHPLSLCEWIPFEFAQHGIQPTPTSGFAGSRSDIDLAASAPVVDGAVHAGSLRIAPIHMAHEAPLNGAHNSSAAKRSSLDAFFSSYEGT